MANISTLCFKVTMKLSRLVVMVLMLQACTESIALILHFLSPDCIAGFSPSQADLDRLVAQFISTLKIFLLKKICKTKDF